MTRLVHNFRLLPIVLIAIGALLVLKSAGLLFDGGYLLADWGRGADTDITGSVQQRGNGTPASPVPDVPLPPRERSWAQEVFNFPDVTGSVPSTPKQDSSPKASKAKPKEPPPASAGIQIPADGARQLSPAERAVLERLSERRKELEARSKELDMRESLVLAAEKRLEGRLAQLKQLESQINEAVQAKDENEQKRIRSVTTMYENMKPKDAARVFDRLDMRVLMEVAAKINPRRMADILAQMTPEAAERLTIELASRARDRPPAELPKIEGQPTAN
jgi:flagellar motility protein MotE (MotC chaperone)